ncbi:hypothetical protein [uncultured Arthrobacter sp.]|uniref:hypothetical protein n=1 Tax=uncultured Arthrobacter sp. TaxID=114050 RepID=UPI0028D74F93|nr:hypothetical protein [uncultured Arthrobacter sp.]
MYLWNAGGLQFLDSLADKFRESELLDWLHKTISDVWAINMARYEPAALGDTAGAFGILSAHNIRQRALKAFQEGEGAWGASRARASEPDGSLLITAEGVNLHILKAPRSGSRTPLWERDFKWDSNSLTRFNAALRNATSKPKHLSSLGQDALFDIATVDRDTRSAVRAYSDVFLVWSGQESTGLTAGWLGIPVIGHSPWVAVSRPLWLDETEDGISSSDPSSIQPTDSADFDALEEPKPKIRLKIKPSKEESK